MFAIVQKRRLRVAGSLPKKKHRGKEFPPNGQNGTEAGVSDFCGARSGERWNIELPRGNVARGNWRAGRPPDLPAREKAKSCCQLLRIAALRALHCRAAPGNSSIAGAAPLDSVRLRRNCSLLLCETQSSSLTCARGADRACAREKAKYRGNSARGADRA